MNKKEFKKPIVKPTVSAPVQVAKPVVTPTPSVNTEKIYKLKKKLSTNRPAGTILSKEVAEALIAVNPLNADLFE